jgi:regulator of RNase E activity RraA
LNEVGPLGFHFFSTDIMVARAESHLTAHNCPVQICGMTVLPGDLIHADCHGAVVIPAEAAPELADACRRVSAAELCVLEPCRKAIQTGEKPTIAQLKEWSGEMTKAAVRTKGDTNENSCSGWVHGKSRRLELGCIGEIG